MQELYSAEQSKQLDTISQQKFSIEGITLMEDASFSAYTLIREDIRNANRTVFVAGGGNNGGDAIAIARLAYLEGNTNISILSADNGKETELRAKQRLAAQAIGVPFSTELGQEDLKKADLIVDGLFGIGLKGSPRAPYDKLISAINESKAKVISLDVPSGTGDSVPFGCSVDADRTICMGVSKGALYLPANRDFAGKIETTFPFFPSQAKMEPQAVLLEETDLSVRRQKLSGYKKTRGSVAIIGGSGRFTGAVVLAAKAAFHAGAGLVTIFTEEQLVPSISKAIPSAMVTTYSQAEDLCGFDSVLCGPGMGSTHDDLLVKVLQQAKCSIIDADGIRAFARIGATATGRCIMTPHLGEYSALVKAFSQACEQSTPQAWLDTLKEVQSRTNATIVVKANTVWIRNSSQFLSVDGQNPSLGVAGSGDVLAGITAALACSDFDSAAANAVLLHQAAGKAANRELGNYSSDELIRFIGKVAN